MHSFTSLFKKNPFQVSIVVLCNLLLCAVPLIFFSKSSELFEFNKIVFLYFVVTLVSAIWICEMVVHKKIIFQRSFLDIPLLLFLTSQVISTLLSIDQRTSLLGYYSRFNGGLASVGSYSLLYWAFVTHLQKADIKRITVNILMATALASIWGVMEHFGKSPSCYLIVGSWDASCWVQDVQLRVFATFGQPNWMAAWIAAVLPLAWIPLLQKTATKKQLYGTIFLTVLFVSALLFTKSRSGIAASAIATLLFSGVTLTQLKTKDTFRNFAILAATIALPVIIFGTPWTTPLAERLSPQSMAATEITGPALETGGTESGTIRKIVWQGAIELWKQFPLFGSGVETFGMAYYRGRPLSHNMVSEWNFLYNKAHNEYLNYLATTGIVGLTTYLVIIFAILTYFLKQLRTDQSNVQLALLTGFCTMLITNFFGFSVVPVSTLFFVFPALSVALGKTEIKDINFTKQLDFLQVSLLTGVTILTGCLFITIANYWRADYLYARAQEAQNQNEYVTAVTYFQEALVFSPQEPLYKAELGALYAELAAASLQDKSVAESLGNKSLDQIVEASALAPQNVRILKSVANTYATLGELNPSYYTKTLELAQLLRVLAPTDPSVLYQEALTFAKLDRVSDAIAQAEAAIQMKPDYKVARRLLAFLYTHQKENQKARAQLEYILKYISPNDQDVQKELEKISLK